MSSLVKFGVGSVFFLSFPLAFLYALFHGYFDHGRFEVKQHLVLLLAGARSLDDQGDAHGFQHGGDIGGGLLRGTVAAILVSAHQVDEEQVGAELLHGQPGGLRGTAQHAFPYLADRLHPANRVPVGNLPRPPWAMRERGCEGVQRQAVAAAHGERPAAARSQRHFAEGAGPFLRFQFQTHAWGSVKYDVAQALMPAASRFVSTLLADGAPRRTKSVPKSGDAAGDRKSTRLNSS